MNWYVMGTKKLLQEPRLFARFASRLTLREYQAGVCEAICDSVLKRRGLTFVVMFPRQSGKNELQAQLEAYLLALFCEAPMEIIKVSPTLKPQAQNAMRRLERTLKKNVYLSKSWRKQAGTLYAVNEARIQFLSGSPQSSIVGATASLLLEVDEAQDVLPEKFDKDIAPMTASTNATRVFWGTAWTSDSLLGRELRAAEAAEAGDGLRRVFRLTAQEVSAEVPAYRATVEAAIKRLGRSHPLVKTQYFSEEIDGLGGLFPPERIMKMQHSSPPGPHSHTALGGAKTATHSHPKDLMTGEGKESESLQRPDARARYAILLDVAGADEGMRGLDGSLEAANPRRDATALTLVEVQAGTATALPVYRPCLRRQWVGADSVTLRREITALAHDWRVSALVVDATGVGAGLSAELTHELPGLVTPFVFNASSKSKLGWNFLGLVDAGRWQEELYAADDTSDEARWQQEFFKQLVACQFEVLPGPERHLRWSVPEGTHDRESGESLHDDWIFSAALAAVLDDHEWSFGNGPALIVKGRDPLEEMEGRY
jgi:hypothetical protein